MTAYEKIKVGQKFRSTLHCGPNCHSNEFRRTLSGFKCEECNHEFTTTPIGKLNTINPSKLSILKQMIEDADITDAPTTTQTEQANIPVPPKVEKPYTGVEDLDKRKEFFEYLDAES